MRVGIIGAGAIGLVVANVLAGHADLCFIADKERKDRYSEGLFYNGKRLQVPVRTPDEAEMMDILIYAVKNFSLPDAIELSRPFAGEKTILLPLLNGIDAEEELGIAFGPEHVLYAFITDISSVHQGMETTCFSGSGNIVFGEKDNSRTARIDAIASLFDEAGQRYTIPEDIRHEKWWKFTLNTCFNTLSAILDADYAAITGNRDFIRLVRIIAKEIQGIASREGVTISQDDIEEMIRRVTLLRDHGKTSMLQDVLAHRETESRYFAGAVSRLGRKHSIPTPYCDFIQIMLEARRHVLNV